MARKTEYAQEAILDAAIRSLRKHDLGELTVRLVAQELGSSTAPVYQQFDSMSELVKAVLNRISEMLSEQCRVPRSDRVFLDIGLGYVLFARDNPGLFRSLFLEKHGFRKPVDRFFADVRKRMKEDPRFFELEDSLQEQLLSEMWIYSHGLAATIISGIVSDSSETAIFNRLHTMGSVVIPAILSRSKKAGSGATR